MSKKKDKRSKSQRPSAAPEGPGAPGSPRGGGGPKSVAPSASVSPARASIVSEKTAAAAAATPPIDASAEPESNAGAGPDRGVRTTLRIGSREGFNSVLPPPVTAADSPTTSVPEVAAEEPTAEARSEHASTVTEAERTTIPPAEAVEAAASLGPEAVPVEAEKAPAPPPSTRDVLEAGLPSIKATSPTGLDEGVVAAVMATKATEAAPEPKVEAPKAEARPSTPPKEDGKRSTAKDEALVTKRDQVRREKKESLSTHLTDEARAFFAEAALESAYKPRHDTFDDLKPAHEDHPHETARSKKLMVVTGLLLLGVVGIAVAVPLLNHLGGVPETTIDTSAVRHTTPPPPPPPAAVEDVGSPPPAAAADSGASVALSTPDAMAVAADVTSVAVVPVEVDAGTVAAAADVGAPSVAPATPTAQTPAELLRAARRFRGAPAARAAAWDAYFNAAPGDDRTMTEIAMSCAEQGRHADAERIAARAVAANERNGNAWFVLAYARKQQRNVDGAREARARCVALGGQWAAECRAL